MLEVPDMLADARTCGCMHATVRAEETVGGLAIRRAVDKEPDVRGMAEGAVGDETDHVQLLFPTRAHCNQR